MGTDAAPAMGDRGIDPGALVERSESIAAGGRTPVWVAIDGALSPALAAAAMALSSVATVPAGAFVVVRFINDDPVFHDWMVEGLANVDAAARPGQTQRVRFRIDRPGTYTITCSVTGHAEAGMVGVLAVTP